MQQNNGVLSTISKCTFTLVDKKLSFMRELLAGKRNEKIKKIRKTIRLVLIIFTETAAPFMTDKV
jgi:hypothetical protein